MALAMAFIAWDLGTPWWLAVIVLVAPDLSIAGYAFGPRVGAGVYNAAHTYLGPAALAYAQRLLEEPRGADREAILDWADQHNAAWACHAAFECTEACPSDVRPAQRIMALRRELRGRRRRQAREIPETADEEARS